MARTLSANEYRELGKRFYKQKEYQKAIEAFTDGIESSDKTNIELLESRALIYAKLKDFNNALKDGRAMIKASLSSSRGYLRTGQILQMQEKWGPAVDLYRYALKRVSAEDEKLSLLQVELDKLTRQIAPPKAIDPFTVLPVELVQMVLSYMNFRDIVICRRVCKGWNNYLIRNPNLWTNMDLSLAKQSVSGRFIKNCMCWSKYKMTRATLHRFADPSVLRSLTTYCKDLTELEFITGPLISNSICEITSCAKNLQKFVYGAEVTLNIVSQVLHYRPGLVHAEFNNITSTAHSADWTVDMPGLKVLSLKAHKRFICNLRLSELFLRAPALENLTLKNLGDSTWDPVTPSYNRLPLTHLNLVNQEVFVFPPLPRTLTHLTLHPWYPVKIPKPENVNSALLSTPDEISGVTIWNATRCHLTNITHLYLHHISNLHPYFLDIILNKYVDDSSEADADLKEVSLQNCTALTSLSLANNILASTTDLISLLSIQRIATPALTELDLTGLPITDEDVEPFPTLLPSLTHLNLSKTEITGAGVKDLVDRLRKPGLRKLVLDYCYNISSQDVIWYARRKGIDVSFRVSEHGGIGGGKKVRYG
ncbi:hypothetical protein GQ43DRAFT_476603 [Delitschia confertaspora ATCC 74209]|uniref:F-box domain-containing protein n=1 Tax=Delitschia confertaspora ATCC 74209 TaxID=1513339 RepID=A0A9P4JBA7_9PLEO|nr:hypothetical protein GQ43DRAFT_476603 [Delitschia confertaspora ATCC 74209]